MSENWWPPTAEDWIAVGGANAVFWFLPVNPAAPLQMKLLTKAGASLAWLFGSTYVMRNMDW